MISIVFWNVNRKDRADIVGQLARTRNADIVILAECNQDHDLVLRSLSEKTGRPFANCNPLSERLRIYSSLAENTVRPVVDELAGRLSVFRVVLAKTDFLLATVHLHSKLNRTDEDQQSTAQQLAQRLRAIEERFYHQRTVVVGDFNMNPFDNGMVAATGLHAVMTRAIALELNRTVDDELHPFLYNPMWGLLGDRTPGPSGTHYCRLGKPIEYFWNTYDQVLIRPQLLGEFENDLQVLTSIDGVDLLSAKGLPNSAIGSDHLPLSFSLNLETGKAL